MKPQTLWFLCIAAAIIGALFGIGINRTQENVGTMVEPHPPGEVLRFRFVEGFEFTPAYDEYGRAIPATSGENLAPSTKPMKSESIEFELALDAGIEYKALMSQGNSLVYEWHVQGGLGEVYYDFHAHPPDAQQDYFTRYKAGEGQSDQGAIVAAFDGQHGWYWLNVSDGPVAIELRVAGFYEEVIALSVD